MSDYWLEKLKANSKQYEPAIWDEMSEKHRMKAIKGTIELLREIAASNKLHIRFGGELLEFDCVDFKHSKVKIKCDSHMDRDCAGVFDADKNTIAINRWLVRSEHGIEVFENLLHEFAHKLEWEISKRKDQYQQGTSCRSCLDVLRYNSNRGPEISAFGIECGKRLYTTGDCVVSSQALNRKKETLYFLLSSERFAFSMSQSMCKQLFNDYVPQKCINEMHEFRRIYHCVHFSNEQISRIVDHAQENVLSGRKLQNSYEAIVAYDIATTIALHNGTISPEKYVQLQKDETRAKAMAEIGYEIPWKSKNMLSDQIKTNKDTVCDLEYLEQLSVEEQKANPELIFQIARIEWNETLKAVKDIDALKNWYYSESNSVPLGIQLDLGVYLGSDFSPKTRELKMRALGSDVPKERNNNVGIWPYVKTIDQEMSFFDSNYRNEEQDLLIER